VVWVNIEDDPFVLEAEIEAEDESMSVADSETEEAEDEGDVEELDLSALSLEDANEVNAMKPKDFFEQIEFLKKYLKHKKYSSSALLQLNRLEMLIRSENQDRAMVTKPLSHYFSSSR